MIDTDACLKNFQTGIFICNTIGSFVTRKDDYGHLMRQDLQDTYKHLALDYSDSPYTKALENGQDRYLVFEGRIMEPKQSAIPRGEMFDGDYNT
ncbi:hypothetical protein BWD09_11795 [Neisseria dentiae]|uniref:Uncharacterized protein n=1 Tax=Neisseria dentiae TaxID=194197 RepID=A0A1X3D242_9NEIS|nr:hypothetical protein [Neisseria dentiae]OSI13990.1 hypothetical protein BWD09_11795 [Neisseria dentiae]QMT44905.1 hypothetical protein H3L92_10855 [Neisseria dentiae]